MFKPAVSACVLVMVVSFSYGRPVQEEPVTKKVKHAVGSGPILEADLTVYADGQMELSIFDDPEIPNPLRITESNGVKLPETAGEGPCIFNLASPKAGMDTCYRLTSWDSTDVPGDVMEACLGRDLATIEETQCPQ